MNNFSGHTKDIFKEDQNARRKFREGVMDYKMIQINDNLRRKTILKIIKNNKKNLSGIDCFYSAFPFHHSHNITHLKIALKFAKESLRKGYKKAEKLVMAIEDRMCLVRGIPQKHGTQFMLKEGKLVKYRMK